MILPTVIAALVATGTTAEPMMVDGHVHEVVKVVVYSDDASQALQLPEDMARLGQAYPEARFADTSLARNAISDLVGPVGTTGFLHGAGFDEIVLSKGEFPPHQVVGWLGTSSMSLAEARATLHSCAVGAPESLGTRESHAYLLIRIMCPERTDEFRQVYAVLTIDGARLNGLVLNIGDLPTMDLGERASAAEGRH